MIKIELNEFYGWVTALKGLRRPYNKERDRACSRYNPTPDDLRIMQTLIRNGDDHAKIMRMIGIGITVRAPRYWWMEMDTFRLGRFDIDCEGISESTMHRRKDQPFTEDDFEFDGSFHALYMNNMQKQMLEGHISFDQYKANMPEAFMQTREMILNYQALRHIYRSRRKHRLQNWQIFCDFIETDVPYAKEVITLE